MPLIAPSPRAWLRILSALTVWAFLLANVQLARAESVAAPGAGGAAAGPWRVCDPPPMCFASAAARQSWAQQNSCRFPEDVCEGTTPDRDRNGARPEDQGFWGRLWGNVQGALVYGYEFVRGASAGLKGQVTDLWNMVTHPREVVQGLVQLGRAFFDDPRGTLTTLATLLGQEAADLVARATQCGAYDLGKVIGENVSPATAFRLATRLTRYGGRLSDATRALRRDYGCASFAAGTPVLTPDGWMPIERLTVGAKVQSRHETSFAEQPQAVIETFGRTVPRHRLLQTEFDTLRLTDEHPLWVQGKGWTEAKDVTDDDVIAGQGGDALVLRNEAVQAPLRVYNFAVARTPSYFVGSGGLWAHNARCRIDLHTKPMRDLVPKERGFRGEWEVFTELTAKGYTPVGRSFDPRGMSPDDAFRAWDGQTGIDGIYRDARGNYVIVESKATGGVKASDPQGCVARLCNTDGGRQMSDDWIQARLERLVPDAAERDRITRGLQNGTVKKIYAQTDQAGTTYHEVSSPNRNSREAVIGRPWNP